MKDDLMDRVAHYMANVGREKFRNAVKTEIGLLRHDFDGSLDTMVLLLGRWAKDCLFVNDAEAYELGDLVFKWFDFGNILGIAAQADITEHKKTLGRFLYSLILDERERTEERDKAIAESIRLNAEVKRRISMCKKAIEGDLVVDTCRSCDGTGIYKYECYSCEECRGGDILIHSRRCWTCDGLGYTTNGIIRDEIEEELTDHDD